MPVRPENAAGPASLRAGSFAIEPGSAVSDLAEWVRGLPLASLAPAGLLVVGGLLLLAFGRRLLKPVLVVAAIFAGVVLAVRIGHGMGSTISPLVWSALGALGGVLAVMLFYRIALALTVGAIASVAAMLLATTAAEFGLVDVGPGTAARAEDVTSAEALRAPDRGPGTFERLAASEEGRAVVSEHLDGVAPGLGPVVLDWLDRGNRFLAGLGAWTSERWELLPRPMRTLLLASAAAGGFLGFAAGLASPTLAAAIVTSLFGALLVLFCGLPILSRYASLETLTRLTPGVWLLVWLALATLGWLFQWTTRGKPKGRAKEA